MSWKQEHPEVSNDLGNYESAIAMAKAELDNLSQSIKLAIEEKNSLISSNHSILREKLDELQAREIAIEKRRVAAEELHTDAHEKNITLTALYARLDEEKTDLDKQKNEIYKSFQEHTGTFDKREQELLEMKKEVDLRESILSHGEQRLADASEQHLQKVLDVNASHVELIGKHKEADDKLIKADEDSKRIEEQRIEIFSLISEQRTNIERLELLNKEICAKVKEQANLLEVNKQKEQSIRDLTIEQRRSKVELDKSLEIQRKASNIMQQQKQELEDLKNQIAGIKQEEV